MTDAAGEWKDVAAIAQSVVTVVAIVVGGYFAYYKLQLFRDVEPHLTVTHEVSHRRIGDSYIHIGVTALLYNSSKVHIDLLKYIFRLQEVAPVEDSEIVRLYAEVFKEEGEESEESEKYIQWPLLDRIQFKREKGEMVIEPGETHRETLEFIVSKELKTVMVYTYFYNSSHSQRPGSTAEGWGVTTIYDIVDDD